MSSSPAVQVDATSLDSAGVSLSTAPVSANPRTGTAFNAATFAAAQPIWFHPMYDGRYLMINSRLWMAAAPIGGTPGAYSTYTELTSPSWTVLDGPTGARTAVPNAPSTIPLSTSSTGTVVTGAASRAPASLYLLSSINAGAGAVLQRFAIDPNGAVVPTHEDVIPNGPGGVVFDQGVQYADPFLVIHGTDSAGNIYRARKPWAKVGTNKVTRSNLQTHSGLVNTQVGWEYFAGTGYSSNSAEMAPLVVAGGTTWTTVGPMSFANYRNTSYATTVAAAGGVHTGQLWMSVSGRPYVKAGSPIALGSSLDGSYLGGGIQLMPELSPNPSASVMTGAQAGLVYAVSTRAPAGGGHILDTVWNIWPL